MSFNINILRVLVYTFASVAFATLSLFFTAMFVVETLGSWPDALLESRLAFIFPFLAGFPAYNATGRTRIWILRAMGCVLMMAAVGYTICMAYLPWELNEVGFLGRPVMFWAMITGMTIFFITGGLASYKMLEAMRPRHPKTLPPAPDDPSQN